MTNQWIKIVRGGCKPREYEYLWLYCEGEVRSGYWVDDFFVSTEDVSTATHFMYAEVPKPPEEN